MYLSRFSFSLNKLISQWTGQHTLCWVTWAPTLLWWPNRLTICAFDFRTPETYGIPAWCNRRCHSIIHCIVQSLYTGGHFGVGLGAGATACLLCWSWGWAGWNDFASSPARCCTIDCTEINPAVMEMATRFFGLGLDERLQVHIADGRSWLAAAEPYWRLFIFIDVFLDRGYVPYRLSTVEFYELCQRKLRPGGILVVNITEDEYWPSGSQPCRQSLARSGFVR